MGECTFHGEYESDECCDCEWDAIREEVTRLRRVNHRHLCGCEESAGIFGCGMDCPCACHPLRERLNELDGCPTVYEWHKLLEDEATARTECNNLRDKNTELFQENAELKEMLGKGPYVPLHQYEEACKQRKTEVTAAHAERDMHWKRKVENIKADNARLRAALEHVAACEVDDVGCRLCRENARQALEGKPE